MCRDGHLNHFIIANLIQNKSNNLTDLYPLYFHEIVILISIIWYGLNEGIPLFSNCILTWVESTMFCRTTVLWQVWFSGYVIDETRMWNQPKMSVIQIKINMLGSVQNLRPGRGRPGIFPNRYQKFNAVPPPRPWKLNAVPPRGPWKLNAVPPLNMIIDLKHMKG